MGSPTIAVKPPPNEPMTWLDWVETYVNTANHMMIAVITVYTTWACWQLGHTSYTLHTLLCTFGYQFFMCEAIMSLYKHNSFSQKHQPRTKTNLHWVMMAIGSLSSIAGIIIYWIARDEHLVSVHAQLGMASTVFTVLGVINGTMALWSRELYDFMPPVYTKLIHNVCGIVAFVTGMASMALGFDKFMFHFFTPDEVLHGLQYGSAVTIVLSLFGAARSFWRLLQGALPRVFDRGESEWESSVPTAEATDGYGVKSVRRSRLDDGKIALA